MRYAILFCGTGMLPVSRVHRAALRITSPLPRHRPLRVQFHPSGSGLRRHGNR